MNSSPGLAKLSLRSPAPPRAALSAAGRALAIGVLLASLPLMVALWSAAALAFDPPAAWMAIIVVVDASLLLHLLRWPPDALRTALTLGFLLACAACSFWVMAAGVVGPDFGLLPWESALRMGPVLFEMVSAPWWNLGTLTWTAAAVALGIWWNR